jgi:hypothetical protein
LAITSRAKCDRDLTDHALFLEVFLRWTRDSRSSRFVVLI